MVLKGRWRMRRGGRELLFQAFFAIARGVRGPLLW